MRRACFLSLSVLNEPALFVHIVTVSFRRFQVKSKIDEKEALTRDSESFRKFYIYRINVIL